MKYHRLTHDQFNEVHEEFAVFLATQGLDRLRWNELKNANSPKIPQLLDLFSDVVWDKIISECTFLEFSTPDQLFFYSKPYHQGQLLLLLNGGIFQLI